VIATPKATADHDVTAADAVTTAKAVTVLRERISATEMEATLHEAATWRATQISGLAGRP